MQLISRDFRHSQLTEMEYYVIIGGERRGPFRREELAGMALDASTLVWRSGLAEWKPISEVPELAGIYTRETPPENPVNLYYAMIGGRRIGPASIVSLIEAGATAQTDVWCEGMPQWQQAGSVPEFSEALRRYAARAYSAGPQANAYYSQQAPFAPAATHTNWLTWAIAGTILGFFCSCIGGIFGIIGIFQANKANTAFAMGDQAAGESANSTARIMTIISLVLAGAGLIGNIILGVSGLLGTLGSALV